MYEELIDALRRLSDWSIMDFEDNLSYANQIVGEAADAIEELSKLNAEITTRELKARMAKPRWIPVTERLPEVRTWVLCYCRANSFDVFRMTDEGHWQYGNRSIYMKGYVTHWMPLPQAPKEE